MQPNQHYISTQQAQTIPMHPYVGYHQAPYNQHQMPMAGHPGAPAQMTYYNYPQPPHHSYAIPHYPENSYYDQRHVEKKSLPILKYDKQTQSYVSIITKPEEHSSSDSKEYREQGIPNTVRDRVPLVLVDPKSQKPIEEYSRN